MTEHSQEFEMPALMRVTDSDSDSEAEEDETEEHNERLKLPKSQGEGARGVRHARSVAIQPTRG